MSRVIAISNRVSPPREPGETAQGGLAPAVAAALRDSDGIWFGWSGETTEHFSGALKRERIGGVTVATVDLEQQDYEEYYEGYANKTLWPLFHYRIDLTAYDRSFDLGYVRVNSRFAETLAQLIEPDDIIWVHDYHLFPLAQALRRRGVTNKIGLFLHIPWPSRQILTTLPRHRDLVHSLFDYDLIGFQELSWLSAFRGYVQYELQGEIGEESVRAFNKTLRVGVYPIGIDTENFLKAGGSPAADESFVRMRESLAGRKMIVGVDRLDYSKGLEERFVGFEQFLADNPNYLERVVMLQIASLSRETLEAYQDLRERLDAASGRINGAYATFDWAPLRYVNTAYRRDELAGIYRAAHAALITPLRDGMNLVAKEYVAAQDPEDPGVLILSRFTGAAAQLKEALIINPFSREEIAEALSRALTMPREERIARWRALMDNVEQYDVLRWADDFIGALRDIAATNGREQA